MSKMHVDVYLIMSLKKANKKKTALFLTSPLMVGWASKNLSTVLFSILKTFSVVIETRRRGGQRTVSLFIQFRMLSNLC